MARVERVVLFDGPALIFRAYFAIPGNLSTSFGLHTNAIFGFASTFRRILAGKQPAFGAVVFEASAPTFREERYPKYKAARPAVPDDLREQVPWIEKLVAAYGFPILRHTGYEADDVIGTLTRLAREAGHEVLIVSGDKDFAQLIGEGVRMLNPFREGSGLTYDPEIVRKRWGVPPDQFVDYLAMVGDAVDGIPGVPGIGKKGAAKLLERFGSLDEILEHTADLKGRQKKTLEENREQALLSRDLATIDRHVPIETGLAELALPEVSQQAIDDLFRELEFYSLLSEDAVAASAEVSGERTYEAWTDPAAVEAALADTVEQGPAIIGVLDQPVAGWRKELAGLAIAPRPGVAGWIPLLGTHAPASLTDPEWAGLRAWLEDPAKPKLCHDAKELWLGLRRLGVELRGARFDTRLASYLIDPTKLIPHRLDQVVKEYLHRTVRPVKSVVGSGKKQKAFSTVELEKSTAFACHLVDAVAELGPLLASRVEQAGFSEHLREHELPLSWLLGEMERTGIKVDVADLDALGDEFREEMTGFEAEIHELAGHTFNVGSTKQLSRVLFEELELPVLKKTKTGYSTKVEVLERLAAEHPIAGLVLQWRQVSKLINTYTDVLQREAHPETHRIHATFKQTVGASGRIITTDPDLQRTPVKTERGQRIRQAFIAEQGSLLVAADWSQIELRLMAHISEDPLLCEAFRQGRDIHSGTAAQLFDCAVEDVTPDQRRIGKTVNFATIYGQGSTALSQILSIPRAEAQRYIDGFFAAYSEVRSWLDETGDEALEKGYVTTLLNRRRNIPELSSNNHMIRQAGVRIATNTPIQGSAADICKLAMLELDRRMRWEGLGARMVLQIHDELLIEAPADQAEQTGALAKEVMEGIVELQVPLVAEVGMGRTWGDAH